MRGGYSQPRKPQIASCRSLFIIIAFMCFCLGFIKINVHAATTYTVTYNANGGSGSMTSQTVTANSAFKTKKNTFTRTGYTFAGWNEKADGTGTTWGLSSVGVYESGKTWKWTYTKNITLYAQWTANKYTVTYNANGGTGSMTPDTVTYNSNYKTKANVFKRNNCTFAGWNEKADGTGTAWGLSSVGVYESGKTWKWRYAKNITLYAQWNYQTQDISKTVNIDSSYYQGAMFFSKDSKVIKENDCDSSIIVKNIHNEKGYSFISDGDKKVSFKITNCAYDADGDLCDVKIWTSDYQDILTWKTTTYWGNENQKFQLQVLPGSFVNNTNSEHTNIYFTFDCAGARVRVNMQYYKSGTTTPANVTKQFGRVMDIDQEGGAGRGKEEAVFIEQKSDTVLYKSSTATLLKEIGVQNQVGSYITQYLGCNQNDERGQISYKTSFENGKTYLEYSGAGCGIVFTYTSPNIPYQYTVKYDGNNGISTKQSEICTYNKEYTVTDATRLGYQFLYWESPNKNGYDSIRPIKDGRYYLNVEKNGTKYYLKVKDASKVNSADAIIQNDNSGLEVQWDIKYIKDGYYKITNVNSGQNLEVYNNQKNSGTVVQQFPDITSFEALGHYWKFLKNDWISTSKNKDEYSILSKTDGGNGELLLYSNGTENGSVTIQMFMFGTDGASWSPALVSGGDIRYYTGSNGTQLKAGAKFYNLGEKNSTVTLKAVWKPNTYTITYNGNGATGGSTATSSHNYDGKNETLTPNGFVRDKYEFNGWNTKADGTGTSYKDKQSIKNLTTKNGANITLYAQWLPKYNSYISHWLWGFKNGEGTNGAKTAYQITRKDYYYLKNETFVLNKTQAIKTPKGCWASEYFSSAALTSDGSWKSYPFGTTITQQAGTMGFEYNFFPNTYNITYELNGGINNDENPETYNILYGPTFKNATKLGYQFDGWYENDIKIEGINHTVKNSFKDMDDFYTNLDARTIGDKTVSAHWTPNKYTVIFNANGGSGFMSNQSFTYDQSQNLTTNGFSKTGYTFAGWTTSANGNVVYSDQQPVKNLTATNGSNITLYAKWTPNKYTVSYNANGGSDSMSNQSFTYDVAQNLNNNEFSRTGYTFKGWSTSVSGGVVYKDQQSVKNLTATNGGTVTLYAVWQVNTYTNTISHWTVGYTNQEGNNYNKTAYHLGTTTFTKKYNENYTLGTTNAMTIPNGFYLIPNYGTSSINDLWKSYAFGTNIKQNAGSMSFEYDYIPHTYSITYNLKGGTNNSANPTTYNVLYGKTFLNPSRIGYQFNGWYDGSTKVTGINVGKNASFSSPTDLYNQLSTRTTGNKTISAKWTANRYTVIFNANGGSGSMSNQSFTYDQTQNLTANGFSKTGYTFAGWATSANGEVKYTNQQSVKNLTSTNKATVILYAKWTANQYNLTLNPNNGSFKSDGTTTAKTLSPKLIYDGGNWNNINSQSVQRTGYIFNGWYTATTDGTKVYNTDGTCVNGSGYWTNNLYKGTSNLTVYAQWKPITYTVKYNGNGATGGSTANSSHTYDQTKNLTANGFTKTGYHFIGWTTSPNGSVVYSNQQSVKNLTATNGTTVILYAQWAANTYTIKFDSNGGTGTMGDIHATYDKDVTLPKLTFRKDEYTFIGWSTTKDGDVKYKDRATVKNLTSTNNGTATLYAKWKELPKSHGTSIAILKQDGLKMIENNTLESFIRNEIAFHIDNNTDNITLKDYKITNLTAIQTTIKNTTSKQELELKFEITYSTGDKSYKTAEPVTITIVNVVLGDENTSYTRYIDDNEILKNTSKWSSGTSKNLLNEALNKNKDTISGYDVSK